MSWVRAVAVAFLWTILPGIGWGADMQLGVKGSVEYDDNILRSQVRKKDDVVFRVTPRVEFLEDEGKFNWDMTYRFPWERALDTNTVEGFRHLLNAQASYRASGQTNLFFNDVFTYSDAVNTISSLSELGTPTVGTFRTPVSRNNATLGVQHSFTPRLTGNLALSHRLFDSDVPSRSDAMVYGANTNLMYMLSPHHQLGGGAAGTYQDFDASNDGSIPTSQAFFMNVYASWVWLLDETLRLEVTGGPTFVDTNQDSPTPWVERQVVPHVKTQPLVTGFRLDSCGTVNGVPVLELCSELAEAENAAESLAIENAGSQLVTYQPGGRPPARADSTWTFFGEARLSKRWSPRLLSNLTYRRTESTASGAGSSTLDLVSFLTTWEISELWDAGVRADFTRRESTGPSTETFTVVQNATAAGVNPLFAETAGLTARVVNRSLDTDRWGVSARMSRRLTKHVFASLRYTYNEQLSKRGTRGGTSDFSNHLVTLGVQCEFDRWRLW